MVAVTDDGAGPWVTRVLEAETVVLLAETEIMLLDALD